MKINFKNIAKKALTTVLAVGLLVGTVPAVSSQAAEDDLFLWVNGKYVATDADPFIVNDRTLVPIRFVAESLGYQVSWDQNTRTVTIADDDDRVEMQIGNGLAQQNGQEISLYESPQIRKDRTFVPVRDVAEVFDIDIDWDDDYRTVVLGSGYTKPVNGVPVPGRGNFISAQKAIEIAKGHNNGALSDSILTGFEYDDNEIEVELYSNGYKYEIEIDPITGAIKDVEIEEEDDIPSLLGAFYLDDDDFDDVFDDLDDIYDDDDDDDWDDDDDDDDDDEWDD